MNIKKFFNKAPASTLAAISKISGRRFASELSKCVADRREYVREAARALGTSEDEYGAKVAEALGLPYLTRLSVLDAARLPGGDPITRFLRAGATLVLNEGEVIGFACVCPELLSATLPEAAGYPVYMASFTEIYRTLSLTADGEKAGENQSEADEVSEREVDEALLELYSMAREYGDDSFIVSFTERARYSFSVRGGGEAKGEIADSLRVRLRERLSLSAAGASLFFTVSAPADLRAQRLSLNPLVFSVGEKEQVEIKALPEPEESNIVPFKRQEEQQVVEKLSGIVVIIDDEPTFAGVLTRHLKRQGIETCYFADPAEALYKLLSEKVTPYAIVCDYHMPAMTGETFARELRQEESLASIPLIMLTSDDDVDTHVRAIEAGVNTFINKQQSPRIVSAHIRAQAKRARTSREAA